MQPIIKVEGITKVFPGGLMAVDGVDLEVREGEFVTLLGPSGCGKSTILRMIAGFESPDGGFIYLAGKDVTQLPPYRRDVNMVFQDYALFPHMNVRQNVGYGLRVTGVPKQEIVPRVDSALSLVELSDKADNQPGQLSGGQRQRVALARALVREPKVLLLDEPLSALDANLREAMQVELKHLHEKLGITFIMVTHDQTEALVMADRIVVMQEGKVSQSGSPADLYDRPQNPYVANFIGTSNFLPGQVEAINADIAVVRCGEHRLQVFCTSVEFRPGHAVSVCVRPEKVALQDPGSEPSEGQNKLTGKVAEILYHGANARVRIDAGFDSPLLADIQLQSARYHDSLPVIGEAVDLLIGTHDVHLFDRGEDS
jgi:putative spermidine/putrescine transport system ATP-binding protein/spermidine/putrescine transport system ATP-binding protein